MNYNLARDFKKNVKRSPENFYIIHYSCQNLNDENEALSPRITSIAVAHVSTEQTVSFSTHAIAEELKVDRENVFIEFDRIEKRLLDRFFEFVKERRDKFWIHWNMRNSTYGFEHIEHRYSVLGGSPAAIPVENRINLNDVLAMTFGADYVPHPKMKKLMELNGGIHRQFLDGKEEVRAFQDREFIRMHNSTLCKVGFFTIVIRKLLSSKLRTSSSGFWVRFDRYSESRIIRVLMAFVTLTSFVASVIGIAVAGTEIYASIFNSS